MSSVAYMKRNERDRDHHHENFRMYEHTTESHFSSSSFVSNSSTNKSSSHTTDYNSHHFSLNDSTNSTSHSSLNKFNNRSGLKDQSMRQKHFHGAHNDEDSKATNKSRLRSDLSDSAHVHSHGDHQRTKEARRNIPIHVETTATGERHRHINTHLAAEQHALERLHEEEAILASEMLALYHEAETIAQLARLAAEQHAAIDAIRAAERKRHAEQELRNIHHHTDFIHTGHHSTIETIRNVERTRFNHTQHNSHHEHNHLTVEAIRANERVKVQAERDQAQREAHIAKAAEEQRLKDMRTKEAARHAELERIRDETRWAAEVAEKREAGSARFLQEARMREDARLETERVERVKKQKHADVTAAKLGLAPPPPPPPCVSSKVESPVKPPQQQQQQQTHEQVIKHIHNTAPKFTPPPPLLKPNIKMPSGPQYPAKSTPEKEVVHLRHTGNLDPVTGTVLYTHLPEEAEEIYKHTHDAKLLPPVLLRRISDLNLVPSENEHARVHYSE